MLQQKRAKTSVKITLSQNISVNHDQNETDSTCCEALSTMLSPSTLPPPLSKHVGFVILMGGSAPAKTI
jgi:hypothetical protein